jgi:hypothetical protein
MCLERAQLDKRFTIHGLRYTFTDVVRRANVDVVVLRGAVQPVTAPVRARVNARCYDSFGDKLDPLAP